MSFLSKVILSVFLWMEAGMRCTKIPRSVEQNWETITLPVCLVFISRHLANDVLLFSCCSIQFKFYLKILLIWAEIKTDYSVKSWSCHFYCTVKENSNHFSGGRRAFSCIGSQSTLQPVMNFAQVFEWGKEQSWAMFSATKCWWNADSVLSPQWERALSLNIQKRWKGISWS